MKSLRILSLLVSLAVSLAFGLSGCLMAAEDADCNAASCDSCLQRSGCGWCPGQGCVPGTSLGPDPVGVSVLTCQNDYRWDECTPRVDPCQVHRSADRCVLATDCEWCDRSGTCSLNGYGCEPVTPTPVILCTNTCRYASDGDCDDGGPGSTYSGCEYGTDCDDCGARW